MKRILFVVLPLPVVWALAFCLSAGQDAGLREAHGATSTQILSVCYQFGTRCIVPRDGETVEWGSPVVVQPSANGAHVDIYDPDGVPVRTFCYGGVGSQRIGGVYVNKIACRWHKIPGLTYTLSAGVDKVKIRTEKIVPIPPPHAKMRRGFLALLLHPWSLQLRYACSTRSSKDDRCIRYDRNVPDEAKNASVDAALDAIKGIVTSVRTDYVGSAMWGAKLGSFATPPSLENQFGIMDRLHSRGIEEMPNCIQYGVPRWEDSRTSDMWTTPADYATFCKVVVQNVLDHARSHGYTIHRVLLMNEPNQSYWCVINGRPNCRDGIGLAEYFKQAYAAVKAVDRDLVVVAPEVANGGGRHLNMVTFLNNLYAGGCRVGVCWDVLSVHTFPWATDCSAPQRERDESQCLNYKLAQRVAIDHGDPRPHVQIDEFGLSEDNGPLGVDEQVQARYMSIALNLFASDPTVDCVVNASLWNGDDGGSLFGTIGLGRMAGGAFVPGALYHVFQRFALRPSR